jgi:hypothetical protein
MLTPIYLIVLDKVSHIFRKQLKLYILFQSFLQLLVRPPLFLTFILGIIIFSFTGQNVVLTLQISSKVRVSLWYRSLLLINLHINKKYTQLLEQSTTEQRNLFCEKSRFIVSKTAL